MQQLRRNMVSRAVSYVVIAALLAPHCLVYVPMASAQGGQSVPAVAVIPFTDLTNKATPALMREVTAAAALALEDSREYVVTSTTDLDREMAALGLQAPLSVSEQIRLGERLHVGKVLTGSLANLEVDARTGRAMVTLRLMLLDVAIGEVLDGAAADIETKAIPGFTGDVAQVTHEALRQAAEAAVSKMLSASVRRGVVELVDDQGNININLGQNDGLEVGSDLLVMRPTWQPDVEQVVMRRVGIIRVGETESDLAVAHVVEGPAPTTGDRIYRIYKPVSVMQAEARSRNIKETGRTVAAVLALLGLIAIASGPNNESPSQLECALAQSRPGALPVIRLTIRTGNTARESTHGYLIFRAANNPDFPSSANYLIDLVAGRSLTFYSDDPTDLRFEEDQELTFAYRGVDGEEEDATVTVSWIDAPLTLGNRYFYKVRRAIEPLLPAGANPPLSGAQVELPEPSIEVDPDGILSDASSTCGPVTYFNPPILSTPADNAVGQGDQNNENVTFTWQRSVGANEYIVQVFPASDPDGLRNPILTSGVRRVTGTVGSATIRGPFAANTLYYWRVGARQSTDPNPPVNLLTGESGWLYSDIRSFTTALSPPPPPGTTTASPRPAPSRHGGWWGGGRGRN